MIFVSYWFIVFALVFFVAYWLARPAPLRLAVLAIGCVVFHFHFAGPAGVLPIIVLATVTYLIGLTRNPHLLIVGMAFCAGGLLLYKYAAFFSLRLIGAIYEPLGTQLMDTAHGFLPAAPPLAISFFTFEFIHYLFDVRRGSPSIKNPLHFGLFALFWPSLVAGPIKRYEYFVPQIAKGEFPVSGGVVASGLARVAIGFVKKGVADNLTIWLDYQAPHFDSLDMQMRWFFFLAQALRIYFDFDGYSDMAIGFARMMGIGLAENFDWPYLSRNITEFWRRWHITLSTWIRDYIYIPIGGSRHGIPRKVFNSLLAFALCGLWHGADWNFVIWGLYHGFGLAVNANYQRVLGRPGDWIAGLFRAAPPLSLAVTFLYVGVGWFLFFYPLQDALDKVRHLVS